MAVFDFPAEISFHFLQFADDRSFVSFASCNRQTFQIAQNLIQRYRASLSRHLQSNTADFNFVGAFAAHVPRLMIHLLLDRSISKEKSCLLDVVFRFQTREFLHNLLFSLRITDKKLTKKLWDQLHSGVPFQEQTLIHLLELENTGMLLFRWAMEAVNNGRSRKRKAYLMEDDGIQYRLLIQRAAQLGHPEAMSLLLKRDPSHLQSVADQKNSTNSLLHGACMGVGTERRLETIQLLLDQNVPVDIGGHQCKTPLISVSDVGVATLLLDNGADINVMSSDGRSMLHWCSSVDLTNLAISRGFNLENQNPFGRTPIQCAIHHRNFDVAQLLVESGSDVNATDYRKKSVLHYAVVSGNVNLVETLLKRGANIEVRNKDGQTPLLCAIGDGIIPLAQLLLQYGANLYVHDNDNIGALHLATASKNIHLTDFIFSFGGFDLDGRDRYGRTALHIASHYGCPDIMTSIHNYGAKPDTRDNSNFTILDYAIDSEHLETVQLCLRWGLNTFLSEQDISHALSESLMRNNTTIVTLLLQTYRDHFQTLDKLFFKTVSQGNIDMATFLLEQNVSLTTLDGEGRHPLHIAVMNKDYEMMELLLHHITIETLEYKDKNGFTPLRIATELLDRFLCEDLVEAGAEVNTRDSRDLTPLHYLALHGPVKLTEWFLERGADVSLVDDRGMTPLHLAAVRNDVKMVKLLLKFKAKVNKKSEANQTALDIAQQNKNTAIAECLSNVKVGKKRKR